MPQALLQWRSPLKAMAMPAGSDGNARWKRSARRAQSDRIDLSWVFQGRLARLPTVFDTHNEQ